MLSVRVVSPPDLTGRLRDLLAGAPGVQDVVLRPGAAQRPNGDETHFHVIETQANAVFRELRALGLDDRGTIAVDRVDVALTRHQPAQKIRFLRRQTAPLWEIVEAVIRDGAIYPPSFYILLNIASLIAVVGILTNSQILIVGAMVVGPEYSAIIAVALGLTISERGLIKDGLSTLLWGFCSAIVSALVFSLAVRAAGETPQPYLDGVRPVASLIDSPNWFSVTVAILAGLVGVVSIAEAKASTIIGVFISVTTIPAAASVGLSIAYQYWSEAAGSLVQLLLNVSVLIGVGALGLATERRIWRIPRLPPA